MKKLFYKERGNFPSSKLGFYRPKFTRSPGLLITGRLLGSRQILEPWIGILWSMAAKKVRSSCYLCWFSGLMASLLLWNSFDVKEADLDLSTQIGFYVRSFLGCIYKGRSSSMLSVKLVMSIKQFISLNPKLWSWILISSLSCSGSSWVYVSQSFVKYGPEELDPLCLSDLVGVDHSSICHFSWFLTTLYFVDGLDDMIPLRTSSECQYSLCAVFKASTSHFLVKRGGWVWNFRLSILNPVFDQDDPMTITIIYL